MKNKGYAKFRGANKLHYGRCVYAESFLPELFIAISPWQDEREYSKIKLNSFVGRQNALTAL